MTTVRREMPEDVSSIRQVHEMAFGRSNEADLVDALRQRGAFELSLVAIQDARVVGHILFSPVTIVSRSSSFNAIGLGPMAVLPAHQRTGIGSQLVHVGLEECRKAGHGIVVIVGHPAYYSRFGFSPAKPRGIEWEIDVPDDVFMVAELREGALAGRTGVVKYQPEFTSFCGCS